MDVVVALGGGGIKGVGHIPVLEALDDLGVWPIAISGTSIGALVGAAYAGGMTGSEIRSHVKTLAANKARAIWALVRDPRNQFLGGGVSPEAAVALALPDEVPHRFEDLTIPFAAVATDFLTHEALNLSTGDLRPAVAASIAIPGIFEPVSLDGRTLVDGGLVHNLPVLDLPNGYLIAVDVLDTPGPNDLNGKIKTAIGGMKIMIKKATAAHLAARPPDLLLEPKTAGVGPLDLGKIEDVLLANAGLRDDVKRALGDALDAAPN